VRTVRAGIFFRSWSRSLPRSVCSCRVARDCVPIEFVECSVRATRDAPHQHDARAGDDIWRRDMRSASLGFAVAGPVNKAEAVLLDSNVQPR